MSKTDQKKAQFEIKSFAVLPLNIAFKCLQHVGGSGFVTARFGTDRVGWQMCCDQLTRLPVRFQLRCYSLPGSSKRPPCRLACKILHLLWESMWPLGYLGTPPAHWIYVSHNQVCVCSPLHLSPLALLKSYGNSFVGFCWCFQIVSR